MGEPFLSWVEDILALPLGPRVCERENTSIDAHLFACAETGRVSLVARFRTLKPETFADEKLNECLIEARFLFVGLWCFCDDMGRRQYFPKRIKMEVFPGDDKITPKLVDSWMHDLDRAGVIRIYSVNGQTFFWLPHFLRHQRVDKPSHSDIPPHPDDPDPDCQCFSCRVDREEINSGHHNRSRLPKPRSVPDFTRRTFDDHSGTLGMVPERSHYEGGREVVRTNQDQNQNQHQGQNQPQPLEHTLPLSSQENRRTPKIVVDEIAMRMLQLLELKPNSLMLQTLTKSIAVKARSKGCTYEASAQQIAARAAFVAAENPPEDWVQWFEDVRYEYVPQGDDRLRDRHIEARPVCGGSRCSEGWEIVKVNNVPVLRRCPDCAQLWQDGGV